MFSNIFLKIFFKSWISHSFFEQNKCTLLLVKKILIKKRIKIWRLSLKGFSPFYQQTAYLHWLWLGEQKYLKYFLNNSISK